MGNKVASTLKIIGIIIGVVGIIGAFVVSNALGDIRGLEDIAFGAGFYVFLSCGFSALCVFAFGEVISLLQDIRANTEKMPNQIHSSKGTTATHEQLDESIPKI